MSLKFEYFSEADKVHTWVSMTLQQWLFSYTALRIKVDQEEKENILDEFKVLGLKRDSKNGLSKK